MVDWELERARGLDRQERHVVDVDSVVPPSEQGNSASQPQRNSHAKLDAAKAQGKKTVEDCRALAAGLNAKMSEIGEIVKGANQPHGLGEHLMHGLGAMGVQWAEEQFAAHRRTRIRSLDLADAVKEIQNYTIHTIQGLGQTEGDYRVDLTGYEHTIEELLNKQRASNQPYLEAQKKRESLEGEIKLAEEPLAKATQEQRPALEVSYERLKRLCESAAYDEKTYLATLHEAQRALPIIQESRDAAALSIQSIHAMRQASLEKFVNFRFMLERATTALKAQARIEEFLATAPAFNAMVTDIAQNNVATAGAALETWADRARHAAVDPALAQKMVEELLTHVEEARNDLLLIAGQVSQGERLPLLAAREKVPVLVHHRQEEQLKAREAEEDEEEDKRGVQ